MARDSMDMSEVNIKEAEMDALVAYLQMLGTLVDFSTYQAEAPENRR